MTDLENHKIVPENEWIHSRNELLKKEEFTILHDQLSQQRKDMPWVGVNRVFLMDQMGNKLYRNFLTEEAN
jgi:predicted dithiol-disulfide oxidoreductase (DUF899 family)